MFAILFTQHMDRFYSVIVSFPTVVFTCLLVISLLFWLVAILGFLELDFLDIPDVDTDNPEPGAISAILIRLGLNSVPFTVIVSFISLFGWLISYYFTQFITNTLTGGFINFIVDIGVLFGATIAATIITSIVIRPIRPFFKALEADVEKIVVGQIGTVRTSRVDENFGEAFVDDQGAGLILKIRANKEDGIKMGDKVVLIEFLKEQNAFTVVTEAEFRK